MTRTVLLGDVVDISSSKRIFYGEYVKSGVPFYRSKEIIEKASGKNEISTELFITEERFSEIESKFGAPQEGDLLLTSVGTLGVPYLVQKNERFYFKDGNLTWFRNFKPDLDPNYLLYWLTSQEGKNELLNHTIGSTQKALTIQGLKKVKIPLPEIETQKKIADVLGTIDEKIELNRRMNETLEQMGQALFRHYFIDNPESDNWEDGAIADLVHIYSGHAFKRTDFDSDGAYGLVTIKNVQDGSFISECSDHLSELPPKIPEYIHLKTGDVLLSLTGNVGRVCIVTGKDLLLNQRVAKLVGIDGRHSFAYFLFRQSDFKERLISMSRGTAQLNLSPVETKQIKTKQPPRDMLERFYDQAEPIFDTLTENYHQIQTLTTLRDTLLPRLINGKLRI